MFGYIYYLWYGEDEIQPDEKTLRVRNEMMKQIKKSKIKLRIPKELEPLGLVRSDPIPKKSEIKIQISKDLEPFELVKSDPIPIPKERNRRKRQATIGYER